MKKWTYLLAAGLLAGATPVFTGCIDNDEPEGISILRGAKAELLKAKAAVEAARVAEVQANAALIQAQAKVQEAEATKAQAEAEKLKAEAAIAQAQADLLNAQTEAAKAEAQAIIEENERIQKEWEEQAAVRAAQAEAAIKEAEYAALEAQAKYKEALVALQASQEGVLSSYISDLKYATDEYYNALEALRLAQRNLLNQDEAMADKEADKEYITRDLQRQVTLTTATYNGAKSALAQAQQNVKDIENMPISELDEKQKSIQEELNSIQKAIADLSVEAAEAVYGFYTNGRIKEVSNLLDEWFELGEVEHQIPAIEFDFGDGAGYPYTAQRGKLTFEEDTYTLNNDPKYWDRLNEIKTQLNNFISWTRDENDNEWTNETIAELKGQLEELEKNFTKQKAAWQEAVDAYHTNKYNTIDLSKVSGYEDVTAEIEKFNEAAEAYNQASETITALEKQEEADRKTRDEAITANATTASNAYIAAYKAYQEAMANIDQTYQTTKKSLQDAVTAAQKVVTEKEKALEEAQKGTDANAIITAQAELTAAQNQLAAAETANNNYTMESLSKSIDDAFAAANTEASNAQIKADAAANKAYNDLWAEGTGTEKLKLDAAIANKPKLMTALEAAADALVDVSNKFNKQFEDVTYVPIDIYEIYNNIYNPEEGKVDTYTANTLMNQDKEGLKQAVIDRSERVFGTQGYNSYGEFEARLVELSNETIEKEISEKLVEMMENGYVININNYQTLCDGYGLAGRIVAYNEMIRIATSWLTNSETIQAKIDQATEYITAMEKEYETALDNAQAQYEKYEDAYKKLDADMLATLEPIEAKREELEPLLMLQQAVNSAISSYISLGYNNTGEFATEEYKEEVINTLQSIVNQRENALYEAETAMLNAQKNLENWNAGDMAYRDLLEDYVEDAQALVDRKKKELDAAQSALDAVIANLNAIVEE